VHHDATKPIVARAPTSSATAPSRAPQPAKPGAATTKPARNERARFRALHRLWKHPLGEVVGGTDATTGARVLVTALHPGRMIHDTVLEAARAAAHGASALTSPFIAKPIDVQRLPDGRVGVATEAFEGTPLTNVSRNQALSPVRVYSVLRQLCKALTVAHAAEVVHRAITLGSVILRARAEKPDTVVLTDYGLGPLLDADLVVHAEDAAMQPVTPERMSGQPPDAREDMYLLGCIAYTLLTGGAPFRTGTPDAVRRRHAIEDAMKITDRLRNSRAIPLALAEWVHRCLAKEADDRFENAAELEAALCMAQIDDRVQTPWDDLPLPEVDGYKRTRIAEGLAGRGAARPSIDDQVTVARMPGVDDDEDDDGEKTIVRPPSGPDAFRAIPQLAEPADDKSRSIVLEEEERRQLFGLGRAAGPPPAEEPPAPEPPAAEPPAPELAAHEETVVARERNEQTYVGPSEGGPLVVHEETVVGRAVEAARDETMPIDHAETVITRAPEREATEDTFAGEMPSDATFGGPLPPEADITLAGPAMALPSQQDTFRGPAPDPDEPPTLDAVRPPLPTAPAPVPSVVVDDDEIDDLATRITQLPPVRESGTAVGPAPAAPDPLGTARTNPIHLEAEPETLAFQRTEIATTAPTAHEVPAPPPPVETAARPPAAAWSVPPPTMDLQMNPGAAPAVWDSPAPIDDTMIDGDFGRTRRLLTFLVGTGAAVGLVLLAITLGRNDAPPPPITEPAPAAVVAKPATPPERKRDPALDTATTAAELAVAGERALAQKRLEDAEELFQAAIIREPKHVGALLGLGRMRADAGDWAKAESYYQRAVNAAPKDGTARIAHGDALVRLGKVKDARREYKKAKQLGHPDAAARLAGL